MSPLSNMAVRDIETVIHPYTNLVRHRENGPLILNEGRGIHVYDDKGTYTIQLTVSNLAGSSTITRQVTVTP